MENGKIYIPKIRGDKKMIQMILVPKFIKFLKKIGCSYYESIIPNKKGITEISINGDIPKDKLEKFLRELVHNEFGKTGYHDVNEYYRE